MDKGWLTQFAGLFRDISPRGDARPHRHYSLRCPCRPDLIRHSDGVTVFEHFAWDGREFYEEEMDEWIVSPLPISYSDH